MKQSHAPRVYEYFDQFIKNFIIQKNSIFTDDKKILNSESIQSCIDNFVDNFDSGNGGFDSKVQGQFKGASDNTCLVFAHAEWLWAFAVDDISKDRKKSYVQRMLDIAGIKKEINDVFPGGFGSAGMYHKNNKYHEIKYIIFLIQSLSLKVDLREITDKGDVCSWMEKFSLFQKYQLESSDEAINSPFEGYANKLPTETLAVCNIIPHVAFPDRYERIASNKHKNDIVASFSSLLTQEEKDKSLNTDEKILLIRHKLTNATGNEYFDFYEDDYRKVWSYSLSEEGFSEVQGLQYKKAIVLYGPPGTGKTYTAKKLANALLTQAYLTKQDNIAKYFKQEEDYTKGRVHNLQLHANYTYEDFVAGIQLENHATKAVKGKLFSICDAAKNDKDMPHILILDEINRVDLSRLFGEMFSALENRGEPIEVSIGDFTVTIPNNLYVIGTMNEIDFSLERIDFALRRRFLWFFYGFNKSALREIIKSKNEALRTKISNDEIEKFIQKSEELNHAIIALPELGEQYQVGHTFFAEIVDIYAKFKEINGYTNRLKNKIYRKNDAPAQILWEISIHPILSAFFGNMDRDTKENKLKELSKKFLNG